MRSLGKYRLYCHATKTQLQEYLRTKFDDFLEKDEDVPVKLAVKVIGLQKVNAGDYDLDDFEERKVWVLNAMIHIDSSGNLINPRTSPFIWLGMFKQCSSTCYRYASNISTIGAGVQELTTVIEALHSAYLNNFPPALLCLGAKVISVHYEAILLITKGVPIAILYGTSACGKSTAMETAQSLLGIQDSHLISRCPDIKFLQMTTQTTLGLVLNDPSDPNAISEKIMLLFEGKPIEVKTDTITPRTTFMTSLNYKCFNKLSQYHR